MVLPKHNSDHMTSLLRTSQWLLSSLRVKMKALVPRGAAGSPHNLPQAPQPCTPSHRPFIRGLSITAHPTVSTLPSPSCCDCFSPRVHTPPRAVSWELRHKNLMDNRALLPEGNIWGEEMALYIKLNHYTKLEFPSEAPSFNDMKFHSEVPGA